MKNGFTGISTKIIPVMKTLSLEISNLSWVALVTMLIIAGVLMLFGNEHGSKKVAKRAVQGFALIQLGTMLL